ncbi:MAG: hypothetical protein AAF928_02655 [Myxococcota bacterium]
MRRHLILPLAFITGACVLDRIGAGPDDGATSSSTSGGGGNLTTLTGGDASSTGVASGGGDATTTTTSSSSTATTTTSVGGGGGDPTGGGGDPTGGGGDPTGGGGMGTGGMGGDPLDGLPLPVVRYFFDEQASGDGVNQTLDAAPSPLPLDINYGMGNLMFGQSAPNQTGLAWATSGGDGVAMAMADNTKVVTDLDGNRRFTLEVVFDVDTNGSNGARLLTIGEDQGGNFNDVLALRSANANEVELYFNDSSTRVLANPTPPSRRVLHVRVNTNLGNGNNRLRFWLDGLPQNSVSGSAPAQNAQLTFPTSGVVIAAGNRPNATLNRSPAGTIHYVAVYDTNLDVKKIEAHANRLLMSDDSAFP